MRPSNKSRSRNKSGNNGNNGSGGGNGGNQRRSLGNIINRVFESAGPDGKVRGTPQQIIDKYQALARDAQVSGDRVAAESFLQHSEHYSRMLGEAQREQGEPRFNPAREDNPRGDEGYTEREAPRNQPQSQPQPQIVPTQQPSSLGLVMIDNDEPDYFGGPIETPESNRRRSYEPAPAPVFQPRTEQPEPAPVVPEAEPVEARNLPEPAPESVPEPTPVEVAPELPLSPEAEAQPVPLAEPAAETPPAKPKRPRTRRKAKVETPEEAPAATEAPAETAESPEQSDPA